MHIKFELSHPSGPPIFTAVAVISNNEVRDSPNLDELIHHKTRDFWPLLLDELAHHRVKCLELQRAELEAIRQPTDSK